MTPHSKRQNFVLLIIKPESFHNAKGSEMCDSTELLFTKTKPFQIRLRILASMQKKILIASSNFNRRKLKGSTLLF